MAKSRLEPTKIVRYAESSIPKNGISGIPAPTVKSTPAAAKAAVVAAVEAPAQPPVLATPPPPPPVGVPETRSFFFDGATELTGSAIASVDYGGRTIKMTVRPAWQSDITGSWSLLTFGTPNSNAYREEYKIENKIAYGPFFNTSAVFVSTSSLSTADSASVLFEDGVDAAGFTEVTFNWVGSFNENAVNRFALYNRESPFQEITDPRRYTRKEGNQLVFVVPTIRVTGVTKFKHRIYLTSYQKLTSKLTLETISGSSFYKYTKPIGNSPVGSGDVLYLEFNRKNSAINSFKVNGTSVTGGGYNSNLPFPTRRNLTANDSIAIGGLMSGSEGFFTGSIDQVAIFDQSVGLSNKSYALDFSDEANLRSYYQFEGTTAATTGNDLDVVGTETYISSSL